MELEINQMMKQKTRFKLFFFFQIKQVIDFKFINKVLYLNLHYATKHLINYRFPAKKLFLNIHLLALSN